MSPESFLLTGVDSGLRFKRAHLRLTSTNEAASTASAIIGHFGIQQEPLSTLEEIRVDAYLYMRGRDFFSFAYSFAIRVLVLGFLLYEAFVAIGALGLLAATWVLFVMILSFWVFFQRKKRHIQAWLKLESSSLKIRTNMNLITMIPQTIQWKSSQTFLLAGSRRKVQIYSSTHEDAVQLVSKIRAGFPEVREITDPKGSTSVQLGQTP